MSICFVMSFSIQPFCAMWIIMRIKTMTSLWEACWNCDLPCELVTYCIKEQALGKGHLALTSSTCLYTHVFINMVVNAFQSKVSKFIPYQYFVPLWDESMQSRSRPCLFTLFDWQQKQKAGCRPAGTSWFTCSSSSLMCCEVQQLHNVCYNSPLVLWDDYFFGHFPLQSAQNNEIVL